MLLKIKHVSSIIAQGVTKPCEMSESCIKVLGQGANLSKPYVI